MDNKKKVQFIAIEDDEGCRDGGNGWEVWVEDTKVITCVGDLEIANSAFDPLWEALNINLEFNWD